MFEIEDFTLKTPKDYKCQECKKLISFEEIGYLGSDDDSCSPFTQLTCICKDCLKKTPKKRSS